jgi:cytochrome c peroxidase
MPAFMHNGAFVRLEDAVRHHLDPYTSARSYTPSDLPPDLRAPRANRACAGSPRSAPPDASPPLRRGILRSRRLRA